MSKIFNKTRQEFLLTFFPILEGYDEKEVNGFWLIKQYNGNLKHWEVHIYSKKSFENYTNNKYKQKERAVS